MFGEGVKNPDDNQHPPRTVSVQSSTFEVSSSPAIFQRIIESILPGIPQTVVYIDDILVTRRTEKEHLQNLNTVLEHLQQAGAHLKKEKCHFMLPEVEHLGHLLSAEGLKPSPKNVRAIQLHWH